MIKQNLETIEQNIKQYATNTGREPDDILLVAVSKTKPINMIQEAIEAGTKTFGENKVQEAYEKFHELKNTKIEWHLIGHIQKNKSKKAVEIASLIHAVDSISLLNAINRHAADFKKIQNILIQVNTSGEESKFGLTPNETKKLFKTITNNAKDYQNINIQGLMTMAPFTYDEKIIRDCFKKTKQLFDELKNKLGTAPNFELKHLSMGMTNDYKIAIEEGATILRIGSAIFGDRNY